MRRMLADPACRLITIIGPGGIGKTRLALEAAARAHDPVAVDVAFVPLQAVPAADLVPAAIASAVGCPLSGMEDVQAQLIAYLRRRTALVLLDNLEHLVNGAALLSDLLAAVPGLRLLVTSREALNLRDEWRFPLGGMAVPADPARDDFAQSDAVQLFLERARRACPDFALEHERAGVARICRLVEGSPLAIELAAAWTRLLPCAAIADEIARNLALLASPLRDVPDRHRSMRAAFDHSWMLLSDAERDVFMHLSVFRGGFARDAAAAVAGATLSLLAALADKSLLRHEGGERYRLHELLRQYAAERLTAVPDARDDVLNRHSAHYLALLAAQADGFSAIDQCAAMRAIAADLENCRSAWERALARGAYAALQRAIDPLSGFYLARGPYLEAIALLARTVDTLKAALPDRDAELALALARVDLAWFYLRIGRVADARVGLEEGLAHYARLNEPPGPGSGTDPVMGLALIALVEGRYDEAARLGTAALERAEAARHMGNLHYAWYVLTQAALAQGDEDAARAAAERAAAAAVSAGDRWFLAYCRIDLGLVAERAGDFDAARGEFQASFALREEFEDPEGMAVALAHLGRVALRQGERERARVFYEQSRALYEDLGDRGGLAAALLGLGMTALADGDLAGASGSLVAALRLAREMRFVPLLATILVGAGELLDRAGLPAGAAETLALARHHGATRPEDRDRALRFLDQIAPQLAPAAFAAAIERGRAAEPESYAAQLDATLTALSARTELRSLRNGDGARPSSALATVDETLAEPLTEREIAVLLLIAAGRSNQQIADQLFLALSTIKWYVSNLLDKLQVRNRTEAVSRARALRILA